jgi:hypothetical protein
MNYGSYQDFKEECQFFSRNPMHYYQLPIDNPESVFHFRYHKIVNRFAFLAFLVFLIVGTMLFAEVSVFSALYFWWGFTIDVIGSTVFYIVLFLYLDFRNKMFVNWLFARF